jgi:hypothetical protein
MDLNQAKVQSKGAFVVFCLKLCFNIIKIIRFVLEGKNFKLFFVQELGWSFCCNLLKKLF